MQAYRKLLIRIGHTRWGAYLIRHVFSPIDRRLYRLTGGRLTTSGPNVLPTLLLTTTGRRSGQERSVPLLYVRDGERLVIAAGAAGPRNPAVWPKNLVANPLARVQIGAERGAYRAHPATDDEFTRYWPMLLEVWPPYGTYAARSGRGAVFVLEPVRDVGCGPSASSG